MIRTPPDIRTGTPADAAVIAAPDTARLHRSRTRTLGKAEPRPGGLLAREDGGACRSGRLRPVCGAVLDGRGEFGHLHVAPRGLGLGRHLLDRAFAGLSAEAFTTCGPAVVRENAAARRFCRPTGGTEAAKSAMPARSGDPTTSS